VPRRRRRSIRHALLPLSRRQFAGLCVGSLTLAAAGCRRFGDGAYARGNKMVMSVNSAEDVKPDVSNLDFLLFPRVAANDPSGNSSHCWHKVGNIPPTIASGRISCARTRDGLTGHQLPHTM
jgi:hypothetical protein